MARCVVCQVTVPDFEQLSDAYNNMVDYLGTLDTSDDIMNTILMFSRSTQPCIPPGSLSTASNILMFYEVIMYYKSPQNGYLALIYPLAHPYNPESPRPGYRVQNTNRKSQPLAIPPNLWSTNGTLSYPLANPFNLPAAFVSTTIHSAFSESVYQPQGPGKMWDVSARLKVSEVYGGVCEIRVRISSVVLGLKLLVKAINTCVVCRAYYDAKQRLSSITTVSN